MIASVRGEVLDVALDHVVIEAAGIGYQVNYTYVDARAPTAVAGVTTSMPRRLAVRSIRRAIP